MIELSTPKSKRLFVVASLLGACAVATACDRGAQRRDVRSALTSANAPPPASTAVSSRTIDNAGFVDNGGRTSDMTGRSEMSGMRGTEAGSERTTGTPGSGLPLRIPGKAARTDIGEGAGAATSETGGSKTPSAGAPPSEAVARLARARCDRETSCNRVGPGRASATQDWCVAKQRERVGAAVTAMSCPHGIDNVQLGTCLNALRGQGCTDRRGDLEVLPECVTNALCAP
jgi:hypothetical protein